MMWNDRKVYMGLLILSCLLLLLGCGSLSNTDSWTFDNEGEPGAVRWRECSWDEVSAWLASDSDCHRKDGLLGYECFTALSGDDHDLGGVDVWFSPCFSRWTYDPDGLTIRCENRTRDLLPIKEFPGCCKGIELSGKFDMSSVTIGDSVKYFYSEASGIDDWPQYYDAYNDLPRFNATSKLKYLSIKRSNNGGGGRKRVSIPSLDMSQFSEMKNLEEIEVFVDGLVLHVEKLLGNNKLHSLFVSEHYGYLADSDAGGIGTVPESEPDTGESPIQEYIVDDASFDGVVKHDFAGTKSMRVEIELNKVQTWNIARLADLHLDVLSISTRNCVVTGVEAFQGGLGANWLNIDMDISRDR